MVRPGQGTPAPAAYDTDGRANERTEDGYGRVEASNEVELTQHGSNQAEFG